MVSRAQLVGLGLTPGQVGALLDGRRWTAVHRGVYATFTGPLPPVTRAWAALLAAGDGAALGGESALWLWGVLPGPPARQVVCVPWGRQTTRLRGARVVRRRNLASVVHPAVVPNRVRVEDALLDVTERCRTAGEVVGVVLRVTSSRRTTPARIREAMATRSRLRHRRLLGEILGEAAEGVQSALESRYRREVERRHGLPRGVRNVAERVVDASGRQVRNRYRDVRYPRWRTVVELDGLQAHPEWLRPLDRRRDNGVTLSDERGLEYGWAEVVDDPCSVAVDVVTVLRREGWRGEPTPCSPTCPVTRLLPRLVLAPLTASADQPLLDRGDLCGDLPQKSPRSVSMPVPVRGAGG